MKAQQNITLFWNILCYNNDAFVISAVEYTFVHIRATY
jgi:hypothetical protein